MQQQALTAPVLRSVVLGGALLGLGLAGASLGLGTDTSCASVSHRLTLHAAEAPDAVYLSRFRNGDIRISFARGELRTLRFETRATVFDGCRWLGIERLVPRDDRSFYYSYNERILSCRPGATPTTKTPRRGIVTIVD